MKRELWIALGCLTLGCLTACGSKGTPAESKWKAAQKAEDTASYVIEHGDELDELKPGQPCGKRFGRGRQQG